MRTFSNTGLGDQPAASNRRQPVRQTRTNPARTASNHVQAPVGSMPQPTDGGPEANPGFFPAITHFTDAITALPKEMIRHYTMLREVDAKIYGPEEVLGQLFNSALKPPRSVTVKKQVATSLPGTQGDPDQPDLTRRALFRDMRMVMGEMLLTLDEKNHVMNTAIDSLDRQLRRCQTSYPHIEEEISEEARYGSLSHWAYMEKAGEKKGMMAGERTRRAANNAAAAAAIHEAEGAAMRSEARREAMAARKHRNHQIDSDFDDGRTVGKKGPAGAKGRKIADPTFGANSVGVGVANAAAQSNKRRKIEKPAAGGMLMDRAMPSIYGGNPGAARGAAGGLRETTAMDPTSKKRVRGGGTINGTGRRRGNTNTSAANSPLASSPVMGTFATAKDRQGGSPAPATLQRVPSSRARQNSTQSVLHVARNRSSSTNHRAANGNGLYGTTADVDKVSGLTGRTVGDVKSSMKEAVNTKGEHLIENIAGSDGASDMRGGLVVGSRNSDRVPKREDRENGNGKARADRPPSISASTRGGGVSKQPSKNGTPITTTFAEPSRSRVSRHSDGPLKRSHKKGAGLAAQLAAAAAQHDDDGSSLQGEEDEDENGDEPRYCYCNGVSYGEMVGCDSDDCPREWFHLSCVGLTKAPAKNAKWYCDECKENLKKSKFSSGNVR